jgi:formylglycine-generating enzyme required for sulfatase activity
MVTMNDRPVSSLAGWESKKPQTWKDPKTGLEWQCESPGEMSWYEAQEYAGSLSLNGKDDWRVPTAAELETLLDRKTLFDKIRPDMREEVPFRDNLSYWSSTTFEDHTQNAWIVMFDGAYVLSYYKTNLYYVRCVRG